MHDASRADRVVEPTVIAIGIVSVLAVVTLPKDFAGLAGADTSRYGYLWWIAGPEHDLTAAGIPAGTYSANGMGGNFVTILPGLRAVVAVTTGPGVEESNPRPPDNTSSAVTGYPPFVRNLVDALRPDPNHPRTGSMKAYAPVDHWSCSLPTPAAGPHRDRGLRCARDLWRTR